MSCDPTVHILDDDQAVRESLRWLVESVDLNVETYASPREFLNVDDLKRPGCLVLDIRMPGMSGLQVQEILGGRRIDIPIIIITGYGDVTSAVRAMRQGAVDLLEKPFNHQELLERIQQSIERDVERTREQTRRLEAWVRHQSLTSREREVMQLVVAGKSNKMMARRLGISPKTIEIHRANIMHKMRVESVADLVRICMICDDISAYRDNDS